MSVSHPGGVFSESGAHSVRCVISEDSGYVSPLPRERQNQSLAKKRELSARNHIASDTGVMLGGTVLALSDRVSTGNVHVTELGLLSAPQA